MAFLNELTLLDSLEHAVSTWLEEGNWSKMTWAGHAMKGSAAGASPLAFGETVSGSFWNAKIFKGNQAIAYKRSIGPDVEERSWDMWLCYVDGIESARKGYRAHFQYLAGSTTKVKLNIYKVEGATESSLGSVEFEPAAKDKYAFWLNGKNVEIWKEAFEAGSYTLLLKTTDAGTAFKEGKVGIGGKGSDPFFTAFEAAEEPAAPEKPVVTKPPEQNNMEEELITPLSMSATGGGTITWSASGLPTGLSISSTTGKITGTPTKAETAKVKVKAKNVAGEGETEFQWVIKEGTLTLIGPGSIHHVPDVNTPIKIAGTHINSVTTSGLPAGMTAAVTSKSLITLEGIPPVGQYSIKVKAKSLSGEEVQIVFELIISVMWLPASVASTKDRFPLHLTIGGEDCTFLLAENFTFSNVDPGGYEAASFPIPKDLPWVKEGMHVLLTSGLSVAWEGRVKEIQRSLGAKTLIQCEGYVVATKEQTMREVFVDRDMTKWGAISPAEQKYYIKKAAEEEAEYQIGAKGQEEAPSQGTLAANTKGEPALILEIQGPLKAKPGKQICLAKYSSPGILLKAIYFSSEPDSRVLEAINFDIEFRMNSSLGELNGATRNRYWKPTLTEEAVVAYMRFPETKAGEALYNTYLRNLAVYGAAFNAYALAHFPSGANTESTLGSGHGTDPAGYYTSEIVSYVVSLMSGIKAGVIPVNSSYIVPHASYLSVVAMEQVIVDMAKFVGCHWGVWESKTALTGGDAIPRLDFRPYPEPGSPTAFCWRSECEEIDIREDIASQYNTVQVTYTEAAGIENTVTVTEDNPILDKAGIEERTLSLNMGTSTHAGAEGYGRLTLKLLRSQANVTGQATIKDAVHNMDGSLKAPYLLKAGIDRLRVPDLPCFDVWGMKNDMPISRVECTGGEDGIATSIEFGAGRNLMEMLVAQLETDTNAALGQ